MPLEVVDIRPIAERHIKDEASVRIAVAAVDNLRAGKAPEQVTREIAQEKDAIIAGAEAAKPDAVLGATAVPVIEQDAQPGIPVPAQEPDARAQQRYAQLHQRFMVAGLRNAHRRDPADLPYEEVWDQFCQQLSGLNFNNGPQSWWALVLGEVPRSR